MHMMKWKTYLLYSGYSVGDFETIRTILEEHSWNVEENTVKPRFQIRHEPEFKDASLINTTDLEQWFGGQDGMSTILNSLQMFEQN